jgi:hypothetical protein
MLTPSGPHTLNLPPPVRRWLFRLVGSAAALGVLWLLGWLVLPPVLKSQLEQRASEALGRAVTVETIHVHPWSLELEVLGLQVARASPSGGDMVGSQNADQRSYGKDSQLSIERLYVDAELVSLFRLAPVLDAIQIDRPVLHVRHLGQGLHDWQDVLDRLAQPTVPPAPDTGPARLAVHNIELRGGEVALHDVPGDRHHALTKLSLSIPLVSTLGVAQEVRVSPRLAFQLNGSQFETEATTQPFHDSLNTEATLDISGFNLAPYLDYLPQHLPMRPAQATLDANLKLAFSQSPQVRLGITGQVNAHNVALTDARRQPVLTLARATIELADVRPLERVALLGLVEVTEPQAQLSRGTHGALNIASNASFSGANKPSNTSDKWQKSLKNSDPSPQTANGWTLGASTLKLTDGGVVWADALAPDARQQPAQLALTQLQVSASQLRWPLPTEAAQAVAFDASAQLTSRSVKAPPARSAASRPLPPSTIAVTGTVLAQQADATVSVNDLALPLLAPYLRPHLRPTVQGQLALTAQATWKPGQPSAPATADDLTLAINQLTLRQFQLIDPGGSEAASLQTLEVRDAQLRPLARTAKLGKVSISRPVLPVQRNPQGQLMVDQWLPSPPAAPAAPASVPTDASASPATPSSAAAATPWAWQLPELTVADGQFGWQDATTTPAVALQTRGFNLSVRGLSSRGGPAADVTASMRVGAAGTDERGSLSWRGTLTLGDNGLTPQINGKLNAQHLPVAAVAPYAAEQLNLVLLQADASFLGSVAYSASPAGPAAQLTGDATLENVRANTVADTSNSPPGAEELLRWKTLNLSGLDVKLAPALHPQVTVERGALSDFFARIAIQENGRINLQDISKPAAAQAAATTSGAASPTTPALASAAAQPLPNPTDALAANITIGPFSLVNGAVDFSDKFIRPNYRANLTDLTGRLGGFSSDGATAQVDGQSVPQMAELELRGKAEGTASLEISGKLNPLAKPLALDIEGRVRDLELPPLSPYTIKYTGHGIERGKLSLDVGYTVLPNGQLTARNQLVLNQLTFGDAVPDAPASLPVKLATALLSDRNGVIDLNLPISGSLNDPEFSLVPVIFKIIGNVIVKAITAPFSLLASALGGSDAELSTVAFAPGTAQLLPAAQDKLARVAKALIDRPSLTLTVVGTANLDEERTAYQRERLQALIRAERQRSSPDATATLADLVPGSAEHTRWLTALYKRTDMPKPRNALGLAKDLAPVDMEALLLTQIAVTDATIQELAVQRGVAVRDQLARQAVPTQRLFLGAPGSAPPAQGNGKPQPIAHLTLALH